MFGFKASLQCAKFRATGLARQVARSIAPV